LDNIFYDMVLKLIKLIFIINIVWFYNNMVLKLSA